MNIKSLAPAFIASALLISGVPLVARAAPSDQPDSKTAPAQAGKLLPVTGKDAAWAAKARASYPLGVCVTSDEKLGSMGKPPEYIYRVEGQPARLVVFCCAGCEEDFMQDPARYLAKIDAAGKAKQNPAASGKSEHKGHH